MIDVRYDNGVYLPAHDIWLDPHRDQAFAFVSHAHADHIGRHAEVILSANTARLMRARLPGERIEHVLEYDTPAEFRGGTVRLLPAGHIFGSAQFHYETDAGSLLYTGDFKLRQGQSAEPTQWRNADTLIMETTFGLPRYVFPPAEGILEDIRKFCIEALEEDAVPVLLGYSLGKAQEILACLQPLGVPVMLHGAVYRMTRLYGEMMGHFPEIERYDAGAVQGKILICPPSANRSIMLKKIKNRRVAMLSGWAMTPGAVHRYQCDAVFPLSDHADYPDLLRYVELVQPKRVLTLHGFAGEFAADLRARGVEAWSLTGHNQLELSIAVGGIAETPEEVIPRENHGTFSQFCIVCDKIAAVTGKKEKIRLLAELLRGLPPEEAPLAAIFLTGRAFAQSDPRVLQVGWALIRRALMLVAGVSEGEFRAKTSGLGDIGKAVLIALSGRQANGSFSLAEAAEAFAHLEQARGPTAKTVVLRDVLMELDATEAAYLVRILTSDLRIGLKEGLVEESIAEAYALPADEVREANMLTGDLGQVVRLAQEKRLGDAGIQLFHPVKVMLASPEPTADAIWERFGPAADDGVLVEDKYDGIRAQIHLDGTRAELFSRDLRPITNQFPELAVPFSTSAILDGEILAHAEGKVLTFFDLQKRLGRKSHADLFINSDIPVVFTAFDLLYLNGRSLLKTPLTERRSLLKNIQLPSNFRLAEATLVRSADEMEGAFIAARARRNEGLIVKDATSHYLPGRRGGAWYKLKKELATLDVVVTGVEQGHGKRSHVLSDYTFAIRRDNSEELLTIGKAYSGLTDQEIEELTAHFEANVIGYWGHVRMVKPDIILEIAFDSIQPSKRHPSGLAMRFPRIKAIRRDKTLKDIDTLSYAESLVSQAA
jgi:DNA ligase-1